MQLKNSVSRYGIIAQLFHWIIVGLVITQFILAYRAENMPRSLKLISTLALHKSIGMTVLMLAILRLLWRWMNPVPADMPGVPRWQDISARVSHTALYSLILGLPLIGWLASSARNFSVSYFKIFTWPNLIQPNETAFEILQGTHNVLAWVLFWLALLHMAAALKHHFINRDNVLRRMLPVRLKVDGRSDLNSKSSV